MAAYMLGFVCAGVRLSVEDYRRNEERRSKIGGHFYFHGYIQSAVRHSTYHKCFSSLTL
jgi:hypothetical protein